MVQPWDSKWIPPLYSILESGDLETFEKRKGATHGLIMRTKAYKGVKIMKHTEQIKPALDRLK